MSDSMGVGKLIMLAAIVANVKEKEYFGSALDLRGLVSARPFCEVVKDAVTKMSDETIKQIANLDCDDTEKVATISGLLFAMGAAARLHGFLELALTELDKVTDENQQLKKYVDELENDMVEDIRQPDPDRHRDEQDMKALQEMRERERLERIADEGYEDMVKNQVETVDASRFGHNSSQREDGG